MKRKDLTFGVPIYNAEKYIEELLNCFHDTQKFSYEILLIDDGSNDNSLRLCNKYKTEKKLDIRVLSQKNHGVSYTRNRIIQASNANWITFVDSDDLISFSEYEKHFLEAKDKNFDLYINLFSKKNYDLIKKSKNMLSPLIELELINSPCTKFYKTDLLLTNNILFNNNYDLGEDLLFNLECYNKSSKTSFFFSKMYDYRKENENSLTHKYRVNKRLMLSNLNKECVSLFDNNDICILKSLEFIRVKGYFSCVKDYIRYKIGEKQVLEEMSIMKKNKRKYFVLNNLRCTFFYNLWFMIPNKIIIDLLKVIYL